VFFEVTEWESVLSLLKRARERLWSTLAPSVERHTCRRCRRTGVLYTPCNAAQ